MVRKVVNIEVSCYVAVASENCSCASRLLTECVRLPLPIVTWWISPSFWAASLVSPPAIQQHYCMPSVSKHQIYPVAIQLASGFIPVWKEDLPKYFRSFPRFSTECTVRIPVTHTF